MVSKLWWTLIALRNTRAAKASEILKSQKILTGGAEFSTPRPGARGFPEFDETSRHEAARRRT
jgi:hypothetical protein